MASNTPDNAASQHHSIVYCPSCGASASLSVVPPSNAGLFCDICASTNLLVSTNDGADWNPLSDAFNALSLSSSSDQHVHQHGGGGGGDGHNSDPSMLTATATLPPQIIQHPAEDLQIQSPTPTIQDEMKRRSLILSELMNFREALYQNHGGSTDIEGDQEIINADMESNMELHAPNDHLSNIARTYNDLLHLRQQSGMFLMDEVDTMGAGAGGMYIQNNMYHNDMYPQQVEEEGMFDDPPQEYVNAHPPVQETEQVWYGSHPTVAQIPKEEPTPHTQPVVTNNMILEDDEDDDDEGQVYATPEQREEMKRRRSELHQDKELRAREMFWRKYGIGSLGAGN
ncbi:hypothetical protein TWF718_001941 [Orbilia javanica]|uniref:Uncharacterized protein n=1 Tax=Orbilia javanica TaxID=47235 RepID=A0AAN8N227_9PEZI